MPDGGNPMASTDLAAAGCASGQALLLHASRLKVGGRCCPGFNGLYLRMRAPFSCTVQHAGNLLLEQRPAALLKQKKPDDLRNEMVLVDAPFTEIGDNVTVDYDGQVRCHSFEASGVVAGGLPHRSSSTEDAGRAVPHTSSIRAVGFDARRMSAGVHAVTGGLPAEVHPLQGRQRGDHHERSQCDLEHKSALAPISLDILA